MSRPAGSYGDFAIKFGDAGGEFSAIKGTARVLEADGSNVAAQMTLFGNFLAACVALALGDYVGSEYYNTQNTIFARPTNGANRETKLLIQYAVTASGKRYTMTLPTLNPTIPVYLDNINARDAIRVDTPGTITTLISTFNAFVVDPQSPGDFTDGTYAYGNPACHVVGLKVVGRNI